MLPLYVVPACIKCVETLVLSLLCAVIISNQVPKNPQRECEANGGEYPTSNPLAGVQVVKPLIHFDRESESSMLPAIRNPDPQHTVAACGTPTLRFSKTEDFAIPFFRRHLVAWPATLQIIIKNEAKSSYYELRRNMFSQHYQKRRFILGYFRLFIVGTLQRVCPAFMRLRDGRMKVTTAKPHTASPCPAFHIQLFSPLMINGACAVINEDHDCAVAFVRAHKLG